MQFLNGKPSPQTDGSKSKRHNAKLCPFIDRQRIVAALANGDSIRAIARALHHSPNTVTAVAQQEWKRVEARKDRIAAQAEQIATRAADLMLERLHNKGAHDIPVNTLVPVFGVAVDKTLSLRGDSLTTIRHIHSIDLSDDDIVAFCVSRSEKRAKAAVVEVPALSAGTGLQANKTRSKKPEAP